jgi:hypothetical protein
MARKINNYIVKIKQQARILSLAWADTPRAGDGNRTRMTGLEGCWHTLVVSSIWRLRCPSPLPGVEAGSIPSIAESADIRWHGLWCTHE